MYQKQKTFSLFFWPYFVTIEQKQLNFKQKKKTKFQFTDKGLTNFQESTKTTETLNYKMMKIITKAKDYKIKKNLFTVFTVLRRFLLKEKKRK